MSEIDVERLAQAIEQTRHLWFGGDRDSWYLAEPEGMAADIAAKYAALTAASERLDREAVEKLCGGDRVNDLDEKLRAALRRWADLEARRRLTEYDDPEYDGLERAAGEAATVLMVEARRVGIAEGLPRRAGEHEHNWIDMRNEYVRSGEMCSICHAIRAAEVVE